MNLSGLLMLLFISCIVIVEPRRGGSFGLGSRSFSVSRLRAGPISAPKIHLRPISGYKSKSLFPKIGSRPKSQLPKARYKTKSRYGLKKSRLPIFFPIFPFGRFRFGHPFFE